VSIVILDEETTTKIAAGEVIERPASVVKELVENALDAGARRIEVEVREAGRELIRVTDDGCGMTREDALLALQRYATSKIRSAEDLDSVTTFGFRGEALPSIAAVSHLTMVTRRAEAEAAVQVTVAGGEVTEVEEAGAPAGTQISVHRLFYNTPARLKFLKSDNVEMGHIVEAVTRFVFSQCPSRCCGMGRRSCTTAAETSGPRCSPCGDANWPRRWFRSRWRYPPCLCAGWSPLPKSTAPAATASSCS